MFFALVFIVVFLPMTILFPTKVINKKRLPKGKKFVVTCNHYSNADSLLLDIKFRRKFYFLAKAELFKNKLLGWGFKHVGGIPVDRNNVSPSTFKQALKVLGKNKQLFIFPEGTRNKADTESMGDIKTGVITFASKGEAEIIPMIMYHKPKVFRKNYVLVGEPLKIVGENPKRLTKDEVENNLERYSLAMQNLRIEIDEYVADRHKKHKNKNNQTKQVKINKSESIKF